MPLSPPAYQEITKRKQMISVRSTIHKIKNEKRKRRKKQQQQTYFGLPSKTSAILNATWTMSNNTLTQPLT